VRIGALGVAVAVTALGAALLLGSSTRLTVYWFGGWRPSHGVALGISFAVDSFGAAGALFAGALTTAALLVASHERKFGPVAYALTLVLLSAAVGFCLTGDLFNLFVFFELMSVCTMALCALNTGDRSALWGALHFAIANSIGAFLVLIGIALLYARTGALNLASIGQHLVAHRADQLLVLALLLITVGFMIKAAIVPFHFWLADAAGSASPPVAMLIVGLLDTLGLYAVARIYWTVFAGAHAHLATLQAVLIGAGVVTAGLGAVMCFSQEQTARMLAFVAISHSGLMLIAIGLLNPLGLAGFGLYAVADGAIKAALFAVTRNGDDEVARRRDRRTRLLLLFAALALAGIPPTGTYLAKGLIEEGVVGLGRAALIVMILVVSAVTAGAVLRLALTDQGPAARAVALQPIRRETAAPAPVIAASILLLGAFALGLIPGLGGTSVAAATRFEDRRSYAAVVLRDAHPKASVTTTPNLGLTAVMLGLASALGAVAVAARASSRRALRPGRQSWSTRALGGAVGTLRAAHSGRIGDSAAWLTFGAATIGAVLALGVR
jgi:multicomponent Na+:H+ antiporter subunit D